VVSRQFPTAAAQVRSCGICGGQSGTGAGFLRVLRFPIIPPTSPHSSSSITILRWYNRPVVASETADSVPLYNPPLSPNKAGRLDNVGALRSHNPNSLHGLLQGQLYLFHWPITQYINLLRRPAEVEQRLQLYAVTYMNSQWVCGMEWHSY
jgi:hypothetical protein